MIDYLKDIFESIKERVNNPFSQKNQKPFAGAFLIALVLYNWELTFTLFNFENSQDRVDKISIIKCYLLNENLFYRIGMPTVLALASIIFYYFFNYISLGITTIFNRWFQALILHLTDRNQNIPRNIYEQELKRVTMLRNNLAKTKDDLTNSKADNENLEKEIESLKTSNSELTTKVQSLNDALLPFLQEQAELKIIYAKYGTDNNYIEVTRKVTELLANKKSFLVSNQTFNNDPDLNQLKSLVIEYVINKTKHKLTAHENHWVKIENSMLVLTDYYHKGDDPNPSIV